MSTVVMTMMTVMAVMWAVLAVAVWSMSTKGTAVAVEWALVATERSFLALAASLAPGLGRTRTSLSGLDHSLDASGDDGAESAQRPLRGVLAGRGSRCGGEGDGGELDDRDGSCGSFLAVFEEVDLDVVDLNWYALQVQHGQLNCVKLISRLCLVGHGWRDFNGTSYWYRLSLEGICDSHLGRVERAWDGLHVHDAKHGLVVDAKDLLVVNGEVNDLLI